MYFTEISTKHNAQRAEKCMGLNSYLRALGLSPVCRMASAAVISPARQRATTRSKLSGKGRGLRPVYLPFVLAIAIPSR